jgi:hypothetical protein
MSQRKRMMEVFDEQLGDWQGLVRKDGWPAVRHLQHALYDQAYRRGQAEWRRERPRLDHLLDLNMAMTENFRISIQDPETLADPEELQKVQRQMILMEKRNDNLRALIAIWRWRKGQLDA